MPTFINNVIQQTSGTFFEGDVTIKIHCSNITSNTLRSPDFLQQYPIIFNFKTERDI